MKRTIALALVVLVATAACGDTASTDPTSENTATTTAEDASSTTDSADTTTSTASDDATDDPQTGASTFQAEVWADNWFALYVNGELIGEDSVPITTERSFNSETLTFDASYPLTIAIQAKDFKETDSGIEYIGEGNQQMGDGGLIAQITDTSSGEVVAVTSAAWSSLVVHRAPLNTECEKDADPDATCQFEITEIADDWASAGFDDSAWSSATEWTEASVGPKDGYDEIAWDASAQLIWGTDLEVDNTVLFRIAVAG